MKNSKKRTGFGSLLALSSEHREKSEKKIAVSWNLDAISSFANLNE